MRIPLCRLAAVGLVGALLVPTADAVNRPNLVGNASVTPASVAVGAYAQFDAQMCNEGAGAANNAYLSTLLPAGVGYSIARQPRGGSCRAIRYGTQYYIYCMVSVRPGACVDLVLNVAAAAAGDYTLYATADGNNLVRETDETDNVGSVVLTAY